MLTETTQLTMGPLRRIKTMQKTHQVVDFGPGPKDQTLGYPFEGTETECEAFADEANANYPNLRTDSERFAVQTIPDDDNAVIELTPAQEADLRERFAARHSQ